MVILSLYLLQDNFAKASPTQGLVHAHTSLWFRVSGCIPDCASAVSDDHNAGESLKKT